MRVMVLALLGTVLATACQPAVKDGMPLAERRLAEKVVDTGLLLPLNEESLRQIAAQQAQQAMMQGMLASDQFVQGAMAIQRALAPAVAEARELAIKGLVDAYNVKELELLAEFFVSKRGENIRANLEAALSPSQELFMGRAQEATVKALEQVRAAWPEAQPAAPAPEAPPSN